MSCEHRGLVAVERVEGCFRVRCMDCGKAGPARPTPGAAREALLVLGVRDGATTTEPARTPR